MTAPAPLRLILAGAASIVMTIEAAFTSEWVFPTTPVSTPADAVPLLRELWLAGHEIYRDGAMVMTRRAIVDARRVVGVVEIDAGPLPPARDTTRVARTEPRATTALDDLAATPADGLMRILRRDPTAPAADIARTAPHPSIIAAIGRALADAFGPADGTAPDMARRRTGMRCNEATAR